MIFGLLQENKIYRQALEEICGLHPVNNVWPAQAIAEDALSKFPDHSKNSSGGSSGGNKLNSTQVNEITKLN